MRPSRLYREQCAAVLGVRLEELRRRLGTGPDGPVLEIGVQPALHVQLEAPDTESPQRRVERAGQGDAAALGSEVEVRAVLRVRSVPVRA